MRVGNTQDFHGVTKQRLRFFNDTSSRKDECVSSL
jgi:hypothetical protein